jgi:hypothetical protein
MEVASQSSQNLDAQRQEWEIKIGQGDTTMKEQITEPGKLTRDQLWVKSFVNTEEPSSRTHIPQEQSAIRSSREVANRDTETEIPDLKSYGPVTKRGAARRPERTAEQNEETVAELAPDRE